MIDPPGKDAKTECIGTKVTHDVDARVRELFFRWKAYHLKYLPLKHVSELPAEELLESSLQVKEEDSPVSGTSMKTAKSTYSVDYIMSIEKKPIINGPPATIGGYLYHNFNVIDTALRLAEKRCESTKLEMILVLA